MRLLIITPSTLRGGVEEYILKIASAALEKGWDVYAAFPKTEGTVSLIRDFMAQGVVYHPLAITETNRRRRSRLQKDLPNLIRTAILLLRVRPDVAQIVLPYTNYCYGSVLACGMLQMPTLVRFGLVPSIFTFTPTQLKLYAWARARNQQWMTVSDNNRKLVCESFRIPENQVLRIYNGTQLAAQETIGSQAESILLRHQIRQELGLHADSRLVLTVGRLDPQKGYSDLISVIPHLIEEFPDLRFVWAGEGTQRDRLLDQLRKYGIEKKVLLLGYRSDVPRLLAAADLFVFPTLYEGHSSALIEAMAYGLPVVASDASGIPEVIEDKVHGLLFYTGDSCDLLETLRWGLRHPEEMRAIAKNARRRAQDFPKQKMIEETLQALEKLAEGKQHLLPCKRFKQRIPQRKTD
ncbi:MAG: glycosyltransferase family 4 protein [Phormidesmis sp.]